MLEATARKFDPGVFEQLLQPLNLLGAGPGDGGARPGQIAQHPDRRRWHKRGADEPVGAQVGQPRRIRDVGLTAGHIARGLGVDQHHRQLFFEQVIKRLPGSRTWIRSPHRRPARRADARPTPGSQRWSTPTCSPSSTCHAGLGPEPAHRPWRPSSTHQPPRHLPGCTPPPLLITPSVKIGCCGRCFGEGLSKTGVSLACSQETIHGPRTTTGCLFMKKAARRAHRQHRRNGVNREPPPTLTRTTAQRNHPPNRTQGSHSISHGGAQLP